MADDEFDTNDDESQTETGRSLSNKTRQTKLESLLNVLTNRRRRYAIYYLQDHEVADLESLATHLAAIERDVPVSALSEDEVTRVQTQLVHADLPSLAEAQLLKYDHRSKTIRYSEPSPLLNRLLRLCAKIDAPDERLD